MGIVNGTDTRGIFIPETHQYVDSITGRVVPSVTKIADFIVGESYEGIDEAILQRAAKHGTRLHRIAEKYINHEDLSNLNPNDLIFLEAFKTLEEAKLPSVIVKSEVKLCNQNLAGTLDILLESDEIADIKTYADMSDKLLLKARWQISLYYYLAGIKKEKGYILHIPKSMKYKYYEIDTFSHEECEEQVKKYYASTELVFLD